MRTRQKRFVEMPEFCSLRIGQEAYLKSWKSSIERKTVLKYFIATGFISINDPLIENTNVFH